MANLNPVNNVVFMICNILLVFQSVPIYLRIS